MYGKHLSVLIALLFIGCGEPTSDVASPEASAVTTPGVHGDLVNRLQGMGYTVTQCNENNLWAHIPETWDADIRIVFEGGSADKIFMTITIKKGLNHLSFGDDLIALAANEMSVDPMIVHRVMADSHDEYKAAIRLTSVTVMCMHYDTQYEVTFERH